MARQSEDMGMRYGIIFDLDGTLLDTLEDLYLSVNAVMKKFGFPCRTRDEVRSFIGNGVPKLIERALPSGVSREVYGDVLSDFKNYYREHCADNTCPYDGIIDLLTRLKENGYSTAVVSNKADFAVKSLCDGFFGGLIDISRGQLDGVPTKPSPESLFAVMDMLGADRYIYVGDSDVDILTAKNAHIPCISVSWGFRSEEFLISHGAENIARTAEELFEEICKEIQD